MAPKRKNDDLTPEQKVELHKKRNRDKQAALRARRAARLKELEEENAKLAAASALAPGSSTTAASSSSSSGTAPPLGPYGSAAYEGVIGRLVGKLRALGVDEREIQALLSGSDGGQAQPPRPAPAPVQRAPLPQIGPPSTLSGYPTPYLLPSTATQGSSASTGSSTASPASAGGSLWTACVFENATLPPAGVCDGASRSTETTPPSISSPSSGSATSDMPFPFSFLFADAGISRPLADPTVPAFGHPLTLDSLQAMPASSSSNSSPNSLTPPSAAGTADPSSTSPPDPASVLAAAASDDAHLSALERGIQALFDKLKYGPRTIGGREGLFKGAKEAQAEADKDMAATQLLILQLLGATSSQKEAYDTQCTISAQELFLLETEDLDPRVHFLPNPAFRVRLGLAARDHGLDLTRMLQSMLEQVQIFGDVWDWTGWKMPDDFMLQLPVDTKTDSLFFPTPANNWAPKTPALRPRPAYLRGSSVRDIILGCETAGAREAGPFATTCTVQLVDQEILSFRQA